MHKKKIGKNCATWNCNGKLVRVGKFEAECDKCSRKYWIVKEEKTLK